MKTLYFTDFPDIAPRREWAQLIGVDERTLVRWEKAGTLKANKPNGRKVLYTKVSIIEHLLGK
jgi:predicted site-specific integrase-resolvase